MSKRTERRAAERAAHKANRAAKLQNPTAAAAPAYQHIQTPDFQHSEITEEEFLRATEAEEAEILAAAAQNTRQTSEAQIEANRQNAQKSTGPTSPEGKQTVSQNRRTHALTGRFMILSTENREHFDALIDSVYSEHNPQGETENRLAQSVIQHYWLMQRAIHLQEELLCQPELDQKKLSLFLRYQTTHERSYYKAQKELERLQKEKRKTQNGFESQNRTQEAHEARTRLQHAKAEKLEIDTACQKVMEAPIPGNFTVPFEELAQACSLAIATVVGEKRMQMEQSAAA
jgi:hypothetical protein